MQHFKLSPMASSSVNGGKGSAGTYQKIINQIPPHDVFISGFLYHCAIMRFKKPATHNIGFDLNLDALNDWELDFDLKLYNTSFMNWTSVINPDILKGKVFMYLDPPYPMDSRKSRRKLYKYEMSDEQHEDLLQHLVKLRCDIAISTYPNDLYKKYLKDWRVMKFNNQTRKGPAIEFLYMNYPKPKELHDYSYLGKDYREREAIKNKNRSLTKKIAMLEPLARKKLFNQLRSEYKF